LLAVFIEGTQSRDRRYIQPRTGLLQVLQEATQDHKVARLAPVSLDYERVPEHSAFENELSRGSAQELSSSGLMHWLRRIYDGQIQLGACRIMFGQPIVMTKEDNVHSIASQVQLEHRRIATVSEFHLSIAQFAGARLLLKTQRCCRRWTGRAVVLQALSEGVI
jgi:glycerol-3-phosphate O-acyltransferase